MDTVLITGASSGIGKATALQLGTTYKRMALMGYSHQEELKAIANQLTSMGVEVLYTCGDISDYEFVKAFIQQVLQTWNHIDILINNAGISYVGLLTDMSIADWHRVMDTNVTSMFNTCSQVVPSMVRSQSGRILNISSIWGNVGASCEVAYSTSKGAINAFTKALGKELAPSNITVNAIAFGMVDTPMNACFTTEEKEVFCQDIPAGRMCTPEEAAIFIQNIIQTPTYLTSQVITFDGGYL